MLGAMMVRLHRLGPIVGGPPPAVAHAWVTLPTRGLLVDLSSPYWTTATRASGWGIVVAKHDGDADDEAFEDVLHECDPLVAYRAATS